MWFVFVSVSGLMVDVRCYIIHILLLYIIILLYYSYYCYYILLYIILLYLIHILLYLILYYTLLFLLFLLPSSFSHPISSLPFLLFLCPLFHSLLPIFLILSSVLSFRYSVFSIHQVIILKRDRLHSTIHSIRVGTYIYLFIFNHLFLYNPLVLFFLSLNS